MSLESNLRAMERTPRGVLAALPGDLAGEAALARADRAPLLSRPPRASRFWSSARAAACGRRIWRTTLRGENPITAAVFNRDLAEEADARQLPNTHVVARPTISPSSRRELRLRRRHGDSLPRRLRGEPRRAVPPAEAGRAAAVLRSELLEPAGVPEDARFRPIGRWMRRCALPDRDAQVRADEARLAPGLHAHRDRAVRHRAPADAAAADSRLSSRSPSSSSTRRVVRDLCGTLYIWLVKPGVAAAAARESRHASAARSARPPSSSRATTRR